MKRALADLLYRLTAPEWVWRMLPRNLKVWMFLNAS